MLRSNGEQRQQAWGQWGEMGEYFCVLSEYMVCFVCYKYGESLPSLYAVLD